MTNLDRFLDAQNATFGGYAAALAEMKAGQKRSHWIWYVFPQLSGLGSSSMAQKYALRDPGEAREYASHPVLGKRLCEITEAVLHHLEAGASLPRLMGSEIDALKLVSSVTLFAAIAGDNPLGKACESVLEQAEAQGFPRCVHSLRILAG